MTRDELEAWLAAYGRAWETRDADAVAELFAEGATYQETPFSEPMRGRAAIRDYWNRAVVRYQREPRFSFEILSLEGRRALAHWRGTFNRASNGARVDLDGVFLLEFDGARRCSALREWWVRKTHGAD